MLLNGVALLLLALGCAQVVAVTHVRRKAPVREKKAYDTNVRGFSPDGSIYQVEYAIQAAGKGGLTIGVRTEQGLVLAAQGRRRSPLLKSSSMFKINDIDACMSCAMSGLLSDGRMLVDSARTWVQEHHFEFDEAPSVEAVASHLSRLTLKFHGYDKDGKPGSSNREEDDGRAMARPVGVALLMAGVDRGNCPVLYHLDPSGAYMQWRAKAIGEKSAAAEAKLETYGPFEKMTVRRAMAVVLQVLKEILGDEFSEERLEMVCVDLGTGCTGCGEVTCLSTSEDDGQLNSKYLEKRSTTTTLPAENMSGAIDVRERRSVEEVERRSRGNDVVSMSVRRHSFRRVPMSELEALLRDGASPSTEL